MRRIQIASASALALSLLAIAAPGASALSGSSGPVSVVVGTVTVGGYTFNASCQDEFYAAGVGSSGATYRVEAAGTATGTNVLDTQVVCFSTQDGVEHGAWSAWTPGDAAAAASSFGSNSLDPVSNCWQVNAFLNNGSTVSSGRQCA